MMAPMLGLFGTLPGLCRAWIPAFASGTRIYWIAGCWNIHLVNRFIKAKFRHDLG